MKPICAEVLESRQFLSATPLTSEPPNLSSSAAAAETRSVRAITGKRDLLYVRVRFSDQSSYPETSEAAQKVADAASTLIESYSGGKVDFVATVKRITLSRSLAFYTDKGSTRIADDTDIALKADGVSLTPFEHISYRYNGVAGANAGLGQVGGKRTWIRTTSTTVLAHELGHNLGLHHSHLANPTGSNPFGSSTSSEYGDPFSNMGSGGTRDWSAHQKFALGWLDGGRTRSIDGSKRGTYSVDLSTHDNVASYGSSSVYLVRVTISTSSAIYLSYNAGQGGVVIHRAAASKPVAGDLIDATPSTESAGDAALKFGKSVTHTRSSGTGDDLKVSVIGAGSKARVTIQIGA